MKISFNSRYTKDTIGDHNGYGYATVNIIESLETLGYTVTYNDARADVGLVFDQPQHAKFYGDQYKILYHPWESTQLKKGWSNIMNQADEVWTPSPLIAEWYRRYEGIFKPIYVYEHGVDFNNWSPVERSLDGPIKFLHVGGEAARKGVDRAKRAFRKAFADNNDVQLTLKMINPGCSVKLPGKVQFMYDRIDLDDLIRLHSDHHVYVYPSYGEGFGLTPLQAMSTGMPTMTLPAWAPYSRYLDPNLNVDSTLTRSPWQEVHPGMMFRPSIDSLVDGYRYAYDNIEEVTKFASDQIAGIQRDYDWLTLTKVTFEALEKRLNI